MTTKQLTPQSAHTGGHGIARLKPESAQLLSLDERMVTMQIDVVGKGLLRVFNAHFIVKGRTKRSIRAPCTARLRFNRSSASFSTRRALFNGLETFRLNPELSFVPPPHVILKGSTPRSIPIQITALHATPISLTPTRAPLNAPSHPLEISSYNPTLLEGQRAVRLPSTAALLACQTQYLRPDLKTLHPHFQRKAPSND